MLQKRSLIYKKEKCIAYFNERGGGRGCWCCGVCGTVWKDVGGLSNPHVQT